MRIQSLLNPSARHDQSTYTPLASANATPERDSSATPTDDKESDPQTPPPSHSYKGGYPAKGRGQYGDFQPHEGQPNDEKLARQIDAKHEEFCVTTGGQIARSTRRIPYASDKRTLTAKTGLEALNVHAYTFEYHSKSWEVMWDYKVGLVRITPFFKALGYLKTAPAKALDRNPGLRDITHSITGGSIVAQGYWMPFKAARAVCTTFCYNIRWALTPIFGYSFPAECLTPGHEDYDSYKIPRSIVKECTKDMKELRLGSPLPNGFEDTDNTSVQGNSDLESTLDDQTSSPPRPNRLRLRMERVHTGPASGDSDDGSEYREPSRCKSSAPVSPKTRPERPFTPIKTRSSKPRSPPEIPRSVPATPLKQQPVLAKTQSSLRSESKDERYFKKRKRNSTTVQRRLATDLSVKNRERMFDEEETRKAAETLLSLRSGRPPLALGGK
ncbi:MAG: hypothetical protein M1821_002675 [Bathelium mastoideum]|nr:MAG: hypothetical protein M1821_002675 [Bathelium mastoideum]